MSLIVFYGYIYINQCIEVVFYVDKNNNECLFIILLLHFCYFERISSMPALLAS
jgi:hypothetical protein